MSYKIKPSSIVIAKLHSGKKEHKLVTKEKTYVYAEQEGEYYVFKVKQPSRWRAFKVHFDNVTIVPDIVNVPDGTYTVVFDSDTNYATVKFETVEVEFQEDGTTKNFFFGKQIISFLSGPDNVNNFTGVAHLDESGGLHVWKKFRGSETIQRYLSAVAYLRDLSKEGRDECGLTYAMKSGRCCKCTRELTVPASLHRGMGPVCAKGGTDA